MHIKYPFIGKIAAIFLLAALSAFFLPRHAAIKGKIKDAATKLPVSGVTIKEIGTKQATLSAADGSFSLALTGTNSAVEIAFVGYETQVVKVLPGVTELEVLLKPKLAEVQDVVVTGYKAAKRKTTTARSSAPMQTLQGRVAGIVIRGQSESSVRRLKRNINADKEDNTEAYAPITENNFLSASGNPLSTFSIDVDAASYSNVRRYIKGGQLPPAGAVRTEELINYFDYQYAAPTDEKPFAIHTAISSCPWNSDHQLVSVALQGKRIPVDHLPASNLVFLIDVSGSMETDNKLPLVKSSLQLLTDQLREQDKVAIVVYAGNAGLVLPATSGANKTKIKDALNALQAGGSTAGGEGIQLAYKIAAENFMAGGNNRVILCTDGDFNVGASSDAAMEKLIEKERSSGIFLTVLGYGMGNYKDSKMEILADKGNGNHAYIDGLTEAKKVLVQEFGGTLFTIAKDVKLQIEFNAANVQAYRLIGYENRLLQKEDFNNDQKDAGDMGSGHTVTALYEIIPAGIKDQFTDRVDPLKYSVFSPKTTVAPNEMMQIKFRYKLPDGVTSQLLQRTILKQDIVAWEKMPNNCKFAAAVAEWGMLLNNSNFKQQSSIESILQLAKGSLAEDAQGYRKEFIGLVKKSGLLIASKDVSKNEPEEE
jgi:Ca-activated chloride channel homolog